MNLANEIRVISCIIIILGIVALLTEASLFGIFLMGTFEYDDSEITSTIKPIFLEGLNGIYYTDYVFDAYRNPLPFVDGGRALGTYLSVTNIIKIALNDTLESKDYNFNLVLCHELLHHYWYTKMSYKERYFYVYDYYRLEDLYGKEYMEENWRLGPVEFFADYFSRTKPDICYK